MTKEHATATVETDREALFVRLYRERWPDVVDFARLRLGPTEAEDAAADAFTRAWKGRHRHDPDRGSQTMWLWGIVRHVVADRLRRKPPSAAALDPALRSAEDVAGTVAQTLSIEAIVAATHGLSDVDREIIALRFGAGLTNRSIAELLGRKEGNVAVRLHRAIKRLRVILDKDATEAPEVRHG